MPQGQDRQLLGDDLLKLQHDVTSLFLVDRAGLLLIEAVVRLVVVGAGRPRRHAQGSGIRDAAVSADRQIEIALPKETIHGAAVAGLELDLNTNLFQIGLNELRLPGIVCRRDQSDAIVTHPHLIEQSSGLCPIHLVGGQVGVVPVRKRRDDAQTGHNRPAMRHLIDNPLPIHCVGNGFPEINVVKGRPSRVKDELQNPETGAIYVLVVGVSIKHLGCLQLLAGEGRIVRRAGL